MAGRGWGWGWGMGEAVVARRAGAGYSAGALWRLRVSPALRCGAGRGDGRAGMEAQRKRQEGGRREGRVHAVEVEAGGGGGAGGRVASVRSAVGGWMAVVGLVCRLRYVMLR